MRRFEFMINFLRKDKWDISRVLQYPDQESVIKSQRHFSRGWLFWSIKHAKWQRVDYHKARLQIKLLPEPGFG